MYYPYFRGKQYELITIRESAQLLKENDFVPIIEPVKQSLKALEKALSAIQNESGKAIIITNPFHGDHADNRNEIQQFLTSQCNKYEGFHAGILLNEKTTLQEAVKNYKDNSDYPIAFIHDGFLFGKNLAAELKKPINPIDNIFIDGRNGKLYQKYFDQGKRILLRDGFISRRNKDHPPVEPFSDIHVTFELEGMDRFGDFLIVGDDYKDAGGPAYAVAIHITFIDNLNDEVMNIYHFVSDRQDTPTDPAGKFAEALTKLITKLESGDSQIFESDAIKEFRELYARGHYPGLGYVKKLSMKHHLETLADYVANL